MSHLFTLFVSYFHVPFFPRSRQRLENCPSCTVTMERKKPINIVIKAFHVISQKQGASYTNVPDLRHKAVQQRQEIHHPVPVLRAAHPIIICKI